MHVKTRVTAVLLALLLAGSGGEAFAQNPARERAPGQEPVIDQRALDILKKMSDTLAQAKTMRFQARSMVPLKTPQGAWVNLYGTSKVIMEGPDKLFVSTGGDFAPHDFYFDGRSATLYSPAKNLYAVKEAPATIDAMIEKAYKEEGKSFPYADLLLSDPYAVLTKDLARALYVGQSTIEPLAGGSPVKADHLAFSNQGVDWQIWIGSEDRLPRLVVATYLDEVNEPSYSVEMGDWKLDEPVSAGIFAFNNATNASRVEFRMPERFKRIIAAPAAGK